MLYYLQRKIITKKDLARIKIVLDILMSCGHRLHQTESNNIIYPKKSLLKYEPPRLIVNYDISNNDYKKICRATILANPKTMPEFVITVSGHFVSAAFLNSWKSSGLIFTFT